MKYARHELDISMNYESEIAIFLSIFTSIPCSPQLQKEQFLISRKALVSKDSNALELIGQLKMSTFLKRFSDMGSSLKNKLKILTFSVKQRERSEEHTSELQSRP